MTAVELGPDPEMMTVAEACDVLNISRTLAYELAKRDELPVVRLGRAVRFPRAKILAVARGDWKPGQPWPPLEVAS